jgi:ATP-dependent DNA helicase RecQ
LYGVFSNRTLEDLARLRPGTIEEALEIHGIGPRKAERFAMAFLEEIRAFEAEQLIREGEPGEER